MLKALKVKVSNDFLNGMVFGSLATIAGACGVEIIMAPADKAALAASYVLMLAGMAIFWILARKPGRESN